MMKRWAYVLMISAGMALLTACTTEKKSLGIALQTNDLVFSGNPEAQNMFKKIYGDSSETPQKVVEGILSAGQPQDKLYNAAKAMDFADIYAMSVLTDNLKYVENAMYAKSAQNLSVAAIKLHREEIFALKQIKQIDRLMNQQGKILKKLNERNQRDDLTLPELNYRKNLEVALNNLGEIKKQLELVNLEYAQLIKTSDKDLKLEGKRFYELDDFDKGYTPDIFQDSAVSNRREFALAKEKLGGFNAAKARRQAYVDYPPVARLDINGLEIEDTRYEAELFNKAKIVTFNLLEAIEKYQKDPADERLKQKAFDELAALVMTQVELAYRLVEKSSFDFEANRFEIVETKNAIRQLNKKNNLPDYEKIDLLNKEIEQIALEQKEAQILAERAAALRNLYFLAGLSPFDKNMLKGRIKDIEATLRKAFNQDMVTMLSAVKEQERWDDGGNSWAHKDNWLEELIDGEKQSYKKSASKPKPVKEKQPVVSARGKTMMQLGAYTEMDNAIDDQKRIRNGVAALQGYDMFIEDAVVNGELYHRLMVKPEQENLAELCNQVIEAGFDCILK